ncbi:MAG: YbaB/EbfC family nucleoid-associated protein [Anaerolineales bacterium]|jgi:DNA-binding YbaB/EbfC family protein
MSKQKLPKGFGKGMLSGFKQLQERLEQTQAELAEETVEASAGGGAVRIVMSGTQQCRAVHISPELFEEADVEMLQELVMLAVNQAVQDSQVLASNKLGPLTGGLGLPGMGE